MANGYNTGRRNSNRTTTNTSRNRVSQVNTGGNNERKIISTPTPSSNPIVRTFRAPRVPRYYKNDGQVISIGSELHQHRDNTIMTKHSMNNAVVVTTTRPRNIIPTTIYQTRGSQARVGEVRNRVTVQRTPIQQGAINQPVSQQGPGGSMTNSCPPGTHMMPNGSCMSDNDPSMNSGGYRRGGRTRSARTSMTTRQPTTRRQATTTRQPARRSGMNTPRRGGGGGGSY